MTFCKSLYPCHKSVSHLNNPEKIQSWFPFVMASSSSLDQSSRPEDLCIVREGIAKHFAIVERVKAFRQLLLVLLEVLEILVRLRVKAKSNLKIQTALKLVKRLILRA